MNRQSKILTFSKTLNIIKNYQHYVPIKKKQTGGSLKKNKIQKTSLKSLSIKFKPTCLRL